MKSRSNLTWFGIIFLISIEQLIKIIINNNYLDKHIPIIPPLIYFDPMFNRDYSWFNSMLKLDISKWLHIGVVVLMSTFILLFYQYIKHRIGRDKAVDVMFAFIFSGAMCSLIDKVFWNGSLDYILIKGYFTFDLKDVYIDIFIGFLILFLLIKNKTLKQLDDQDLLRDFGRFILRKS